MCLGVRKYGHAESLWIIWLLWLRHLSLVVMPERAVAECTFTDKIRRWWVGGLWALNYRHKNYGTGIINDVELRKFALNVTNYLGLAASTRGWVWSSWIGPVSGSGTRAIIFPGRRYATLWRVILGKGMTAANSGMPVNMCLETPDTTDSRVCVFHCTWSVFEGWLTAWN